MQSNEQKPCPYQTLGVPRHATDDDIKKAYRQKALEWHPDKNSHRKDESEHTFKQIGESYSVLKDPEKRALYDRHGMSGLTGDIVEDEPSMRDEHHGFASARDIFADFFRHGDPFAGFGQSGSARHEDPFAGFGRAGFMDDPFDSFFGGGGLFGRAAGQHRSRHQDHLNNAFQEMDRLHSQAMSTGHPFFDDHFSHHHSNNHATMHSLMGGGFGNQGQQRQNQAANGTSSYSSFSFGSGSGGGFQQRQTSTRFVNGQRTTVTKETDVHGNTTITEVGPTGETSVTVNGVPQAIGSSASYPQLIS